MQTAGYVLVGGRSSRMGTDKALLPFGSGTLATHVAAQLIAAVGSVKLIGDRDRYEHLGYPVVSDRLAGNGPLGGIAAAVADCAEWALVAACDMPNLTTEFFQSLIDAAQQARPGIECVVPETGSGPEPLCAMYHRRSLALLDSCLNQKFLKMREVVRSLQAKFVPWPESASFRNLNTLEDFQAHE